MRVNIVFFMSILLIAGCSTAPVSSPVSPPDESTLMSENILLKKKSQMLERDHAVVSAENRQHRRDIENLKTRIESLSQEMKALEEKSRSESELAAIRYRNLDERSKLAEKEATTRIQELTRMNAELENKYTLDVTRLTGEMKTRDENWAREREKLKSDFTRREFELTETIMKQKESISAIESARAVLEKQLISSRAEKSALEKNMQEELEKRASVELELKAGMEKLNNSRTALSAENEELKKLNVALELRSSGYEKTILSRDAVIEELKKRIESLEKQQAAPLPETP